MKEYYVTASVVYLVRGDDDLTEEDAIRLVHRGKESDIESIAVTTVEAISKEEK